MLSGCNQTDEKTTDQIKVTTTIYPITLITQQIGGDAIQLNSLFPSGADLHSYEPTSQDIAKITDSDIVFYYSDSEEPYIQSVSQDDSDTLYISMVGSDHDQHSHSEEEHKEFEPSHLWLQPGGAREMMEIIVQNLEKLDPDALEYRTNYEVMLEQSDEINERTAYLFTQELPPLITTHNAFSSYAQSINLEYFYLFGEAHDDEPTSKEVSLLIDLINEQNIDVIFTSESDPNNALMKTIAEQTNAEVDVLYTMGASSKLTESLAFFEIIEKNMDKLASTIRD